MTSEPCRACDSSSVHVSCVAPLSLGVYFIIASRCLFYFSIILYGICTCVFGEGIANACSAPGAVNVSVCVFLSDVREQK